ncbi:MAG TPA: FAD-binding monooxygenase [Pseudonocardiaceae bacterium]|nr:FAD-binding monooxygenase [Pseudonocardiaceae bacterium]
MGNHVGSHAVVLGASMAGLLATRVLSESYERVTVVDRDTLTGVWGPRRGVPQGPHAHGLLARGHQILEELFPGLTKELTDESDVPLGDLNGDIRWYFGGHRVAHGHYGLACISATRPILEAHIRNRVAALANVTMIEETDIVGVEASADRSRVIGAYIQRHGVSTSEFLAADLVVDATGRGSRSPVWLEELGYERPAEDKIKVSLAYTTRHYKLKRDIFQGDLSINPVAGPGSPRGAIFSRIKESDPFYAELSLAGMLGDHPPTDHDGFEAFARSLPAKEIGDAISDAEPLTDPVTFRFPASVRKRYERLTRFPAGLLPIGDAVCSFNPVYGQGMSVAALEAMTLRTLLAKGSVPAPRKYLKAIAKVIDVAWDVAAGGDLADPAVEGERTRKIKFQNSFNAKVVGAAMQDATVTDLFFRVACFVESPGAFFKPSNLRKIFWPKPSAPQLKAVPSVPQQRDGQQRAA